MNPADNNLLYLRVSHERSMISTRTLVFGELVGGSGRLDDPPYNYSDGRRIH